MTRTKLLAALLFALPAGFAMAEESSTDTCDPSATPGVCLAAPANQPLPPIECPSLFICYQPGFTSVPPLLRGEDAIGIGSHVISGGLLSHGSIAIGSYAESHNSVGVVIGYGAYGNTGSSDLTGGAVVGAYAVGDGSGTAAFGGYASATDRLATALGSNTEASNEGTTTAGAWSRARGRHASAYGNGAFADVDFSEAFGHNSRSEATYSVALGTVSIADEPYTVSVGNGVFQRRIVNVAPGTAQNDVANMGQVWPLAEAFGGGAVFGPNGFFTPPSYLFISGANYNTVGDALADLDGRVWALEQDGGGGSGPMGPQGYSAYEVAIQNGFSGTESEWLASLVGPEGPQGEPGTGGGEANPYFAATGANDGTDDAQALADNSVAVGANSVADEENTVSVGAVGNERRITNVAEGINDNDAVNVAQMRAADEWNFQRSRDYTDQRFNAMDQRVNGLERRIDGLDLRINQTGAMNAAMAHQTSAGAATGTRSSVSAGVGYYNGASALAVGYNRNYRTQTGRPISVSIGGAFSSGGEVMVGAGIAVGLR